MINYIGYSSNQISVISFNMEYTLVWEIWTLQHTVMKMKFSVAQWLKAHCVLTLLFHFSNVCVNITTSDNTTSNLGLHVHKSYSIIFL